MSWDKVALKRAGKFICVGTFCMLLQLLFLQMALLAMPTNAPDRQLIYQILAFFSSTQVNYWLSREFTWRDRQQGQTNFLKQRGVFNIMAVISLAINGGVFFAANHALGSIPASVIATMISSPITWYLSHKIVFAQPQPATASNASAR